MSQSHTPALRATATWSRRAGRCQRDAPREPRPSSAARAADQRRLRWPPYKSPYPTLIEGENGRTWGGLAPELPSGARLVDRGVQQHVVSVREGRFAAVSADIPEITGRPQQPYPEFIRSALSRSGQVHSSSPADRPLRVIARGCCPLCGDPTRSAPDPTSSELSLQGDADRPAGEPLASVPCRTARSRSMQADEPSASPIRSA
jgi:hypothetical protein